MHDTNVPFHQYYFQNEKPTKYLSTSLISRSEDNQFGRLIIRTNGLCLGALAARADPSNSPFFWSKFVEPKVAVNVIAWKKWFCKILVCGKKWCLGNVREVWLLHFLIESQGQWCWWNMALICWWRICLLGGLWKPVVFLKSHKSGLSDCEVGGSW